jgi:ABC-type transport system involved in multi-copper enzyme maturation permease subunit
MYCSTCGTEIKAELNYCNRCGARVDRNVAGNKSEALEYLSMATGFVGLGGLGLTVGLIAILLNYNVIPQVIVMLTFAFLSAVFGISFLMIQQLSRMTNSSTSEKILEKANPVQLGAVNTAQLEEYRQPAQSVTENTTRTLDEVLAKRN